MGQAMGADFSGVRVHTDARADQLNQSIQAKAFTTGQDLFFRQGAYQPGSREGQALIAHELTHVVQQNRGGVRRYIEIQKIPVIGFGTTHIQATTLSQFSRRVLPQSSLKHLLFQSLKDLSGYPRLEHTKRESVAGLLGYSRHYLEIPENPEEEIQKMDQPRQEFHKHLIKLHSEGRVPRLAHQLIFQNLAQHRHGHPLRPEAAKAMVKAAEKIGDMAKDILNNPASKNTLWDLIKAYDAYQRGTIKSFETGDHSLAPRLMHTMGWFLQMPAIVWGGAKWVNRPARDAVLAGNITQKILLSFLNWIENLSISHYNPDDKDKMKKE